MIKAEASKKDGYTKVSFDGGRNLDVAYEIGLIVLELTKAFLKSAPQEIQKDVAEILKNTIVFAFNDGMKEARNEAVD